MKTFHTIIKQILLLQILLWAPVLSAQLPSVNIYSLEGRMVNASSLNNDSMPMVVVFFKTYEQKCCQQLVSICEKKEQAFSDKGIKVIGICLDCNGDMARIKPFVYGHDLQIDVYVDKNGDLRRDMGINAFPYTIIYDHNKELICKYAGYCANSDDLIGDKLTECLKKIPSNK
ncbi:redoxin domain-containing protein [Lentimicrobium sp. S6]|uniref:TlpA family protein disulfide reductase n=1 Tax=Lentimicrobium sp. S6 TaxID=2735872 RepID=UPI001557E905|nr:redoxin domain-containing protein [Lentimicrobium sp. S6]NPD44774.1 redoxin domain-containing protein [Lentimicrobium sp. S6]